MATKLNIYRGALRLLGPHQLASTSDARPERYALDEIYDDAVQHMLEQGLWNFAIRFEPLTTPATPTNPDTGYDYAFSKPSDFVRLAAISDNASFNGIFEAYSIQQSYIYTNAEEIYLRYVSNDAAYGLDLTKWPQSFAKALEAYMAFESGLPISGDRGNRNDMMGLFKERLARAKTLDAVDERVQWKKPGRWTRARITQRNTKDG
ncbi:MAG: hypothetical protein M9939_00690 [Mesorhizobium sp.]|nr:hypothetical protein [Mesorhizobium sp.]MCO5159624.1 hypothetical protein [Mesorhizobium sp.]